MIRPGLVLTAAVVSISAAAVGAALAKDHRGLTTPAAVRRIPPSTWVTTAGGGPSPGYEINAHATPNTTYRNVVRATLGGSMLRIRLSNVFGSSPLEISASVATRIPGTASASPGTMRTVNFDGRARVVIPAGADAVSDDVRLSVPPDTDVLVNVYVPDPKGPATIVQDVLRTNYVAPGDALGNYGKAFSPQPPYPEPSFHVKYTPWWYFTDLYVYAPAGLRGAGTVVAFGDSTTQGPLTTIDALHRYTDYLFARLQQEHLNMAVVNSGIGGNGLVTPVGGFPAGVSRFGRDVLRQPGVKEVIVLIGINDLRAGATAAQVEGGLRTIAQEARQRGVRVLAGTILPEGIDDPARIAVNSWIKANVGTIFDGYVDFAGAVAETTDLQRLNPAYVAPDGDQLHPDDAGNLAMANAVPLSELGS